MRLRMSEIWLPVLWFGLSGLGALKMRIISAWLYLRRSPPYKKRTRFPTRILMKKACRVLKESGWYMVGAGNLGAGCRLRKYSRSGMGHITITKSY